MTAQPVRVFEAILDRRVPWRSLAAGSLVAAALHALLMSVAAGTARTPERRLPGGRDKLVVMLFEPRPIAPVRELVAPNSQATPVAEPPASRSKPTSRTRVSRTTPQPSAAAIEPQHPNPDANENLARREAVTSQPTAAVETAPSNPTAATGGGTSAGRGAAPDGRDGRVEVLPFMDGMTRPRLVTKVDPEYSREARDANLQGLILAKCIITAQGRLERCRILKGIPSMNQAVLSALASWRYSPVLYRGKPTAVEYIIPIRLSAP